MTALLPDQVERRIKTTDGRDLVLFHTGWSPFSNFYSSPFVIDGQRYSSVEQYYQVQKAKHFGDTQTVIEMLKMRSPRRCKLLGRQILNYDRAQWTAVAKDFMLQGVKEKFLQNSALRKLLLETGKSVLAEATEFDPYWATGLNIEDNTNADIDNWPGLNTLGNVLMNVRDMLPV